jgi:hypothetical protein
MFDELVISKLKRMRPSPIGREILVQEAHAPLSPITEQLVSLEVQ